MIRQYHTHTLQTKPQNIYNKWHPKDFKRKATSFFFLVKMIARLEIKGNKVMHTKTKTNTEPPQTMGGT